MMSFIYNVFVQVSFTLTLELILGNLHAILVPKLNGLSFLVNLLLEPTVLLVLVHLNSLLVVPAVAVL